MGSSKLNLCYRPHDFSKDVGHVNTFKLAPNSSLESSLIPQLADILIYTQLKLIMKVHECSWIFMEVHGLNSAFFMIFHEKSRTFMNVAF